VTFAVRVVTNAAIQTRVINAASVADDGTNGADPTGFNNASVAIVAVIS
jgi:hypothetical protein